jgi:monofunctional glycosyltransferase
MDKPAAMDGKTGGRRRKRLWLRLIGFVLLWAAAVPLLLIFLYAFLPPPSTLMLARWVSFAPVERHYVPLEKISPRLVAAVTASEDARFCRHGGVDWDALREVLDEADDEEGPARGASTITMQTVKNLFLWHGRSVVRKALEIPLAMGVGAAWSKRRVLEVYLNIAEWGEGTFGAEAAARRYFKKSAAALSEREAALLATALPNPLRRNPARPSARHATLAGTIMARAQEMGPWLDCLGK